MVGMQKLSAIAAVSAVAVTGAVASIQHSDAPLSRHLSHRGFAERQLQSQQQPSLIKVQKRLVFTIGDGLGGIINGLGKDLGLPELDGAEQHLHNLRRGLVGDLLGAGTDQGGRPPTSSSSSSPPPATTSHAPQNNGGAPSSNAPAPAPAPSSSSAPANNAPANQPAANNNANANANANNQGRPTTNASNGASNNGGNRAASANPSSNNNNNAAINASSGTIVPQQASAASSTVPTAVSSIAAAASASASAAAASLLSAASASQASAEGLASAAAATMGMTTSTGVNTAATGVSRANSNDSASGGDGKVKVVVPIVVIAASIALIAVAWTVIRRVRKRQAEQYDPHMQSIQNSYHHRSMVGPPLAGGEAAFAVGGAADGLVRDRPRRESYDSYVAGRPMSVLTQDEDGEFSGNPPPMQEVAPYAAVGSAAAPASGRLRNYGSQRGGPPSEIPPAHRVTDSMYVNDYADPRPIGGAVTPFSDEHGTYDVNYYDGSSSAGYNNRAARGIDAAGVSSGAGRPYSPYADVRRGESAEDPYDYDRASSSRRDPFADSKRWSG